MKNKLTIITLALFLSGCVSVYPTFDTEGRHAYMIECPGGQTGLCFDKAAQLCPLGYSVVNKTPLTFFSTGQSMTVVCTKGSKQP